jgi:hypothetical protein
MWPPPANAEWPAARRLALCLHPLCRYVNDYEKFNQGRAAGQLRPFNQLVFGDAAQFGAGGANQNFTASLEIFVRHRFLRVTKFLNKFGLRTSKKAQGVTNTLRLTH